MPDSRYESESAEESMAQTIRHQAERLERDAEQDRRINEQNWRASHRQPFNPVISPKPEIEPGSSAKRIAEEIINDGHRRQAQRREMVAGDVEEVFEAVQRHNKRR